MDAPRRGRHSAWVKLIAASASGLLVAGLFPPFQMSAAVWVALVPLLAAVWSLDGKRAAWKGFGLGWLAGTLSCLVQFNWLAIVSPLGVVVMPLYLGLFWGVFGAFAASLGNPWRQHGMQLTVDSAPTPSFGISLTAIRDSIRSLRVAACHAVVWAGLEWLRGWLFTGFSWNGLGVAFHETPVIAQAADLFGLTGLAMVPVFFQSVLVQAGRRLLDSVHDGIRRTRLDFGIAALIVALLVCYGIIRITAEGGKESVRLKTLLVQINIPQDAARVLWDPLDVHMAYEEETLKALNSMADKDAARLKAAMETSDEGGISLSWPDWVMWPESALTGRIMRAADGSWGVWQENLDTIAQVRSAGPFQLIYGTNELEAVKTEDERLVMKDKGRAWNSLAVMTPKDELQTYRKHHLVIFGETIPFVDSIPLLKKIYEQQAGVEYGGSFTPGESIEPLPIPTAAGAMIGAIPTICFEDSVARLPRKFVRPGPQVIVNVTNDGWFKESAAAAQHFANARFRAIELRRPLVRCANNGVSAAVDTTGSTAHPDTGKSQILRDANGSHFTRGSLFTELNVPLHPSFSLYAIIGDWGVISLALIGLLTAWMTRPKSNN